MSGPTLGVVVCAQGREGIFRTLWTIEQQRQHVAHILVVDDGYHEVVKSICETLGVEYVATKQTNDWGMSQLNYGVKKVRGDYVLCLQAGNSLLPRSVSMVMEVAAKRPGRPIIARAKTAEYGLLWQEPGIDTALVAECLVLPNVKDKLGYFTRDYYGDQCYIHTSLRKYPDEWAWCDVVMVEVNNSNKLWPSYSSQGNISWACDLREDDHGFPSVVVAATILLEEDEHHFIVTGSAKKFAVAHDMIKWGAWACQGKNCWWRVASYDETMIDALKSLGFTLHTDDGKITEYILDWPPSWWPFVPRFTRALSPLREELPDWRDETWSPL
jgi:hypothetical protein